MERGIFKDIFNGIKSKILEKIIKWFAIESGYILFGKLLCSKSCAVRKLDARQHIGTFSNLFHV